MITAVAGLDESSRHERVRRGELGRPGDRTADHDFDARRL